MSLLLTASQFWNEEALAELLNNSDADLSQSDDDSEFGEESQPESSASDLDEEIHTGEEPTGNDAGNRPLIWKKKTFQGIQNDGISNETTPIFETPHSTLEYVEMFLPDSCFEDAARLTNLYSFQTKHRSVNTSADELKTMAGIQIYMGLMKIPQMKLYWSRLLNFPLVTENMTRDRYVQLRNNLHFVDNNAERLNDSDKLWKIRPLMNTVRNGCLAIPRPHYCAIDEQMIPFSGRCPVRQYVPNKPNPVGIKLFVLAAKDGAMLDVLAYIGKNTVCEEDSKCLGVGGAVVKRLMESYPDDFGPVFLFTDRFFTGIKIMEELIPRNIYMPGTIMSNRTSGVAKLLKADKTMAKGEIDERTRSDENIGIVKWKDKKSVLMLSSSFGSQPTDFCKRWSKESKEKVDVQRPAAVKEYNSYMGGVDLLDRYIAYYRSSTKTKKWTVRVFAHVLDIVVSNSWILYKRDSVAIGQTSKQYMSLIEFRSYIAEALILCGKRKKESPGPVRPRQIAVVQGRK